MVTLKTLYKSTEQEVFNQVAASLLAQSAPPDTTARYRDDQGQPNAIGSLIAETEYSQRFENQAWHDLIRGNLVVATHSNLITKLQAVHDARAVEDWPNALVATAKLYGLDPHVVR